MARYLITHSLLSSWLYTIKESPYEDLTTERDPFEEFIQTLHRKPIQTTEAMQKGNDLEALITAIIEGHGNPEHSWFEAANEAAQILRGGVLQYRARREIEVDGLTLVLHGRLDALKAGVIYDTKFSGSYEKGKYINSTQHPTYLELIPEASEFVYLVSNGSQLWRESYRREETRSIRPDISDFFKWLTVQGLMEVYQKNWRAR